MRTLLLIDDDESCRIPTAAMLRLAGWHVLEAGDGETGITLAIDHRPDAILCDLLMPGSNGYQVCRTVRKRPELRQTKFLVITGRDFPADRETAMEAGADDYLVKPIPFEELQEHLAKLLPAQTAEKTKEPLATRTPPQEATRLKFWGVRGSIPTPGLGTVFFGGNTSCLEVRADGELIILDAGSGIRALGHALDAEFGEEAINLTLLITHTHWDHIQGFPFFLPAYRAKNRVHILGYEGARDRLAATLAGQMESPYFPIALKQMPGNIVIEELKEMQFTIGPVRVETCFSNHPGICVGYRLFTSHGSIVYLPDNESFGESASREKAEVMPCNLQNDLRAFIRDADVLVIDAQYNRAEYEEHPGWGHGCVDDVVHFALQGNVQRLYLFHHDPAHDDRAISMMLMHARDLVTLAGGTMRVEAAREGEQLILSPERRQVRAATQDRARAEKG